MSNLFEFLSRIFRRFIPEVEPAEPTQMELLELTLDLGDKIEQNLAMFSFNLSRIGFKEDFEKDKIFVDQMSEWNQRVNFSQSSILDELKIMYQNNGRIVDGN